MNVKCRVCLASSELKMYHSLTAIFPVYFDSTRSVLNILQTVTSSSIPIPSGWPNKICTACLKSLKECHAFIKDFQKSQELLKENMEKDFAQKQIDSIFIKEEEIVIKTEPLDEGLLDPLQTNGEASCMETKPIIKHILKQKIMNPTVAKENMAEQMHKKEETAQVRVTQENNVSLPLNDTEQNKIDIIISDHNYTKDPNYQIQNIEEDSEESLSSEENIDNLKLAETTKTVNTRNEKSPKKSRDVLNVRKTPRGAHYIGTNSSFNHGSAGVNRKTYATLMQIKRHSLKVLKRRNLNCTRRLANLGEMFQCNFCSKIFGTIRGLSLHKYVHTPAYMNKLKCKVCEKQHLSKKGLFFHEQQHLGYPFKCDQCDKILSSKWEVAEHKRQVHDNGLPERYMCNECGKLLKSHNALKHHIIAIHSEKDKAYWCGFCGYKCFSQTYLKLHERCHTNEIPYKCKFCSKSFEDTAELYSHHLMHEQKMRHHCKFCGKGFITLWNMKVHWLNHGGEHKCNVCSKSFIEDVVLKFHYIYRHKIKDIEDQEKKAYVLNENSKTVGGKLMNACDSSIIDVNTVNGQAEDL